MNRASRLVVPLIATAALVRLVGAQKAGMPPDRGWSDFGGGPSASKFVDLDQIKKSNVGQLQVAWFYPYALPGFNPIVVDDVIYVSGRNNALIALDAATGKEIWIHDGLAGMTSRGVNYWQSEDGRDKRLLFAIDGYLQAIDAKSGESIRGFGTNGIVDMREGLRRAEGTDRRVQSRSPGRVWKNILIMGSASGEGWVTPPGDIRAYDIVTGQTSLAIPHGAGAGRVRLRHLAEGRLQVRRRREQLGRDVDRRGARHRLRSDRVGDLRFLRRGSPRHESLRELSAGARRAHRQAPLAFPDRPPRSVGSRQRVGAAAGHRAARRASC